MTLPLEIHLLPSRGHKARKLALFIVTLGPVAFGFLAVFLGQDANWDLRNYHWYNAFAFLNQRYDVDLLPSQTPYFYNPLMDVPFYLLATHVPARVAGFFLGFVQGLNFPLLFMLGFASLNISNGLHKVAVCAALATLGMLGGGGLAVLGTTFYDNVTSLGIFLSALLVVRHLDRLLVLPWREAVFRIALFGFPVGLTIGLKLPSMIFGIGLSGSLLLVGGNYPRRFLLAFGFGCGLLLGAAVTYGYWGWFLERSYGNPFFPYFNTFFKSPYAPLTGGRDVKFIPNNLLDFLFFPYVFAANPLRVGEIPWRDWRIPLLYGLLPAAFLLRLFFGRARAPADFPVRPSAMRYLLWLAVITYAVWVVMFGIYRYLLPLEMLAPLLIVFAASMLPLRMPTRALLAALLLGVVVGSIKPGDWNRRAVWTDHFVEVKVPALGDISDLMILMAGYDPYSHIVPEFPHSISFVRVQSNFTAPLDTNGMNSLIRARIDAHKGRFMALIWPWERPLAQDALARLNLNLTEDCREVTDHLYNDKKLSLCTVLPVVHAP